MTAIVEPEVAMPTIIEIGPEDAEKLLKRNTRNRRLRDALVNQYAGAMERGEWIYNGDPIRVAEDGTILDGQHRLVAVVRSGKPQQFLVVDGLPYEAQDTMDMGAKRSVGDILKFRGEKDVNRLAAIARLVLQYELTGSFKTQTTKPLTAAQIVGTVDRHPGVRDAVIAVRPAVNNLRASSAAYGASYFLFSRVDPVDAEAFHVTLVHGAELSPTSPIFAARRIFTNPRVSGFRFPAVYQGAILIKAWNLWRNGDEVKHIRWRAGGSLAEKFPTVDGLEL